jgi:hypothetical protein
LLLPVLLGFVRARHSFQPSKPQPCLLTAQRRPAPLSPPLLADIRAPPVISLLRLSRTGHKRESDQSAPHPRARARSWPWARMPRPPPQAI